MDIAGHMVQNLFDKGELGEINSYCRCDVLDTYLVFLRAMVLTGRLGLAEEQQLFADTRKWLEERMEQESIYEKYLNQWGEWEIPGLRILSCRRKPMLPPVSGPLIVPRWRREPYDVFQPRVTEFFAGEFWSV